MHWLLLLLTLLLVVPLQQPVRAQPSTVYTTPYPPPSIKVSYNQNSALVQFDVNVTYVANSNVLYTYVLAFDAWKSVMNPVESSLYTPNGCSNRLQSVFNTQNPLPWTSLWTRASGSLSPSAISGQYYAWPTPSSYWSISAVPGQQQQLVRYIGHMTIDQLMASQCAGSNIQTSEDAQNLYYAGTFYVHWVQPVAPPSSSNAPLTAVYSSWSQPLPFVLTVPRQVTTEGGSAVNLAVASVYAFVLNTQIVEDGTSTAPFAMLIQVQTQTPTTQDPVTLNTIYNALQFQGSNNNRVPSGGTLLRLNMSAASTMTPPPCSLRVSGPSTYCVQDWTFKSAPYQSSRVFNLSISINFLLRTCPSSIVVAGGSTSTASSFAVTSPSCALTAYVSSVTVNGNGVLASTTYINGVAVLGSNITYFVDASFQTRRTSAQYVPGEQVWAAQMTNMGLINPNYYALKLQNLWLCGPVAGGQPPLLGLDPSLGIQRYGCQQPETLNGHVNIPASNIFQLVANGQVVKTSATTGLQFSLPTLSTSLPPLPASAVPFTLSTTYLASLGLSSVYIEAQSVLNPTNGVKPATTVATLVVASTAAPRLIWQDSAVTPVDGNMFGVNTMAALNLTNTDGGSKSNILNPAATYSLSTIGGVVLVAAALLAYCIYSRRQQKQREQREKEQLELQKQMQQQLSQLVTVVSGQQQPQAQVQTLTAHDNKQASDKDAAAPANTDGNKNLSSKNDDVIAANNTHKLVIVNSARQLQEYMLANRDTSILESRV